MGEEISNSHFQSSDFDAFEARLAQETQLLEDWFQDKKFQDCGAVGGFELEAWLIDKACQPAGINEAFLKRVDNPLVVPELSTFNVEMNTPPAALQGSALSDMATALNSIWTFSNEKAGEMSIQLMMIGVLPTIAEPKLTLDNISPLNRFYAINEQILKARRDKPFTLDIQGHDHLQLEHGDVVLEAAATSFQVHLQVPPSQSAAFYNASLVASAPSVAAAANSPFVFNHDLWAESRIPVFEQAVAVGRPGYAERVTFGTRYLDNSVLEIFQANQKRYPILLPLSFDDSPAHMRHVRLHNGTIWRWNRALIGFDDEGAPHLRLEHRVIPAGPTVEDCIANSAFYYGLVHGLAKDPGLTQKIPFAVAKDNFYRAAKLGLDASVDWTQGKRMALREIILDELVPLANQELLALDLEESDVEHYLSIIHERVASGQNGAKWQRRFVKKHKADMAALCAAYVENQNSNRPVHTWGV